MKIRILKIMMVFLLFITLPIVLNTGCSDNEQTSGKQVYYCPMHPEVQSDKPGVCPICHMDLVLKEADGGDMAEHMDESIDFNNRKLALANVNTVEARYETLVKELNVFSYLDFAEQNRKIITARFSGRIEKLYIDKTGDYVKKGVRLFEIYSPDLIQAQNDYLLAKNFGNMSYANESNEGIKNAARNKLLFLGITESQINELESSGKINYTVTYFSPFSGTVIEKKVQEGTYVNEGSVIYDIADLSTLWGVSEIYSDDLGLIKQGSRVQLKLQAYPGRTFEGKVDLIYPVVSSESRTVKVRSVFENQENLLKPNMFGETSFKVELGKGLIIPSEAIIFTGKDAMVWVQTEPGRFRMRSIKTGYNINGNYQVLSGLQAGEKVAAEGSYLIDSESQLKGVTGAGAHQGHTEENIQGNIKKEEPVKEEVSHVPHRAFFNEVCPVLGNEVPEDAVFVEYNGKKIAFCCPGCDKKFLENPDKYMKNLSSDGKEFNKQS